MKLCHLPSLGMRNIKTVLAVFICVMVFALMGPEFNPLFAAIAAVRTMGPSIENSIETGWNRILGTIFGGAAGLLGIFAANLIPYEFAYVAIIPLEPREERVLGIAMYNNSHPDKYLRDLIALSKKLFGTD